MAAPSFTHQVKPVNEEPDEEENLSRDSTREDEDQSQEARNQDSEEDLSEEVPRAAPNLPPRALPAAPLTFRPPQTVTPSVRVIPATVPSPPPIQYRPTPPPPPPIQYRPTQKPTKAPRKQIIDDITFQQPIKPPKPVKPSHAYEIRGKKPVAQVGSPPARLSRPRLNSYFFLLLGLNNILYFKMILYRYEYKTRELRDRGRYNLAVRKD